MKNYFSFLVLLLLPLSALAAVDLVLNNTDAPFDPVPAGSIVTYSLSVDNSGDAGATGVTTTHNVPALVSYEGVSGGGVVCAGMAVGQAGPGVLTCTLPDMAVAANVSFQIDILTTVSTFYTLSAVVNLNELDDITNNTGNEGTTVNSGANVAVTLSPANTSASSGSSFTWALALSNSGPDAAVDQRVTVPVPAGFNVISLPAGCVNIASIITCDIAGPIASGATLAIGDITGVISAAGGSTVTATAAVALSPGAAIGAPQDPDTSDNTFVANVTVNSGTDLAISKSRSVAGNFLVGDTFDFTLSPSYTGDSPTTITVTDNIPANYTIGAVASPQNGWTCNVVGQLVTCTRPNGGANGVTNQSLGNIVIPVTVATAGANISNTTTISAVSPNDPNPANDTATDGGVNLLDPTVDLGLTKSGPVPALVVAGVPFDFSIAASNTGNTTFSGDVIVTDSLPAGLTVNSYNLNGWDSCTSPADPLPIVGPATITCQIAGASIPANGVTPTLTMTAVVAGNGAFINSATVSTPNCNLGVGNCNAGDTSIYNVTSSLAGASADIRLIKSADTISPASILAGEVLTYTLEVVNDGPQTSNTVVLTDTFANLISTAVGPVGEGYISEVIAPGLATGSGCSTVASASGRALTCNFATIPLCVAGSGDCPVVTIQVRPGGDGGIRTNSANAISNGTSDPDHSNETPTVDTTITARADITVTKTVNPASVPAGQNLTYVITVPNSGPSAAAAVVMTDTLPENVTFVSATPSSGNCPVTPGINVVTTVGNKTLTCNLGSINNGSQQTVTVVVRPTSATRGTNITNNVDVSSPTEIPVDTANNSDSVVAAVTNPSLDLVLNKSDSVDPLAIGDNTVYTVTVTNSGPSTAENVVISDTLPAAGLSFQSVVASQGSCGPVPPVPAPGALGGNLVCQIGTIAAGSSETITVTMTGVAKGTFANNASVTSTELAAGFDTLAANDSVSENTTVRTKTDMQVVSKTPSVTPVNIRDNFDFVITVQNNGPDEADAVVVTDNLPAGMQLTGNPTALVTAGAASSTACTGVAGDTAFTCDLGTVDAASTITITLPVEVVSVTNNPAHPQQFTNSASVATSSLDIVPANNTNTGVVDVNSSSIAGRVFRDFDNSGTVNGADAGISGITMTITGTAFDGGVINTTVVTDGSGNYTFDGLPQGTYTVTEGAIPVSEHVADGIDTAGTAGGSVAVNDEISAINLAANTIETGYLFAEIPVPLIGLAKSAGVVVDHLDGTYSVPFTFTVRNAGGNALNNIQVLDDLTLAYGALSGNALPAADEYIVSVAPTITNTNNASLTANAGFTGSGANTGLLDPALSSLPDFGANASSAQINFTIRFNPSTLGPFNNTGQASGTSTIGGINVTDDSVNGTDPDPTNNNDPTDDSSPTPVNIFGQAIGVAKEVSGAVVQTGTRRFKVPYSLVVSNVAQVATATNVQVVDDLNAVFPTAQTITISTPAAVNGCGLNVAAPAFTGIGQNKLLAGNQNLLFGESCTITFTVEVDFGTNALPAGAQNNQATATTEFPLNNIVSTDLSDNGVVPDPNGNNDATEAGENDPTPISFAAGGLSSVSGKVWLDSNHDRIDNDGPSSPVAGFIVEVVNAAGQVVGTTTSAADGTYTVTSLFPSTPGDPTTEYTVRFRDPANGAIYGSAVSQDPAPARNGTVTNGVITAISLAPGVNTLNQSLPLDPSGVVYDSTTRLPVPGATVTLLSGGIVVPDICLVGGINAQVTGANGFYQFLLNNPPPVGCPGDAVYTLEVIPPGGYLPPESTAIPSSGVVHTPPNGGVDPIQAQAGPPTGGQPTIYHFDFDLTLGASADVVNNHIPLDPILGGAIVVTKRTPKANVIRGELVPYTITATNTLTSVLSNISIQDQIPAGFKYVKGSATIDGVKTKPTRSGRSLTWTGLTFASEQVRTIQLILIVGAGVSEGKYVNQAWALNSIANTRVSNVGFATVRVVPDPLFDCSDLIGKVFDDKNINGYQDEGEPGIAGVRVVTVRGLLITTDDYGRFHLACADVPNELHGSNFIMKLDPRTLPTGYRITTENPRVVRLTRGKLVKLNFGAALHRILKIDLDQNAFNAKGDELSPASVKQLNELVEILKQQPSQLRLIYSLQTGEKKSAAKVRTQLFAKALTKEWQQCDCDQYALTIEQEILELGKQPTKRTKSRRAVQ